MKNARIAPLLSFLMVLPGAWMASAAEKQAVPPAPPAPTSFALMQGTFLKAGDIEIHLAKPASFSLTVNGDVYRASLDGPEAVAVTLTGFKTDGAVVAPLKTDDFPGEPVPAKIEGKALTFTAQPGTRYLIGPEATIYAPRLTARFDNSGDIAPGNEINIIATVTNPGKKRVTGEMSLIADGEWIVLSPLRHTFELQSQESSTRTFDVKLEHPGNTAPTLGVAGTCGGHALQSVMLPVHVLDLPRTADIKIPADSFSGQGGGSVEVTAEKTAAEGKSFLHWDDKGQWLEFPLEVKTAGRYTITLRYCTAGEESVRDLKIDGKYPGKPFEQIRFPGTGGWSNGTNDWRHLTITDAKGKPALVELAAGKHVLRMENLDGVGLNLNYIALDLVK